MAESVVIFEERDMNYYYKQVSNGLDRCTVGRVLLLQEALFPGTTDDHLGAIRSDP